MKRRILVIDDSASVTGFLKVKLEQTGVYDVQVENTGERGLEAARLFKPDLIILDIMMPGMDGGDVLAELRNNPHLREVPVVFLTATVKREETAMPGGMTIDGRPVIAKPVHMDEVLACLEKYLA